MMAFSPSCLARKPRASTIPILRPVTILLATPAALPCVAASIESKTASKKRRIRSRFSATNWKARTMALTILTNPPPGTKNPAIHRIPFLTKARKTDSLMRSKLD